MSVGELARRTGVSTATINFYVKEGLLPPPRRINKTRAAYNARHERVIALIKRLQGTGVSLAFIKRFFESRGLSDESISTMEQIGSLQPLPAPRGAPDAAPLAHFDPVDRSAFLVRAGIDGAHLDRLEQLGLVRPVAPGRYDHNELWVVRNLGTLLEDGLDLDDLATLAALVPTLRAMVPLVTRSATRHREALRTRQMRFRDVLSVYANVERYLFARLHEEEAPGWRETLFGDEPQG